ncbi:MAG TPA: hypothetical protein P5267_00240, partial [Patescibacteria group bacterium]|nr:hypothetical protein [Patescibacteria group bacterium]
EINAKLDQQKLGIKWDETVIKKLLQDCLRRGEGARVVREIVRQEIEDLLADKIIKGKLRKDRMIKIEVVNNKIKLA